MESCFTQGMFSALLSGRHEVCLSAKLAVRSALLRARLSYLVPLVPPSRAGMGRALNTLNKFWECVLVELPSMVRSRTRAPSLLFSGTATLPKSQTHENPKPTCHIPGSLNHKRKSTFRKTPAYRRMDGSAACPDHGLLRHHHLERFECIWESLLISGALNLDIFGPQQDPDDKAAEADTSHQVSPELMRFCGGPL